MADAYTTTATQSIDQAAYDKAMYFALRPELFADSLADVKPDPQTDNGSSVVFTSVSDLAAATTALNESVDVDAVAMSDSQTTITLVEQGNAVVTTAKLRGTSIIPFIPAVANVLGYNAGLSIDTIAMAKLGAGTNVRYGGASAPTARNRVLPTDTLRSQDIRRAYADLYGNNAAKFNGYYAAIIHPDVAYDLRGETGTAAWRDPHVYSQPDEIWNGELGEYEGFRFMVTPRAPLFADAGSSTTLTDVYRTLFMGRQALAKAYSTGDGGGPNPAVVAGPVVDKLRRFVPMGWYQLVGYGTFRTASLRGVETASTIGSN